MVKLIEPQLIRCLQTKKDHKLLMALLELDIVKEEELNCLCDEYKAILRRKDEIIDNHKTDSIVLDRLFGLITDCYIDRFKLIGINVKTKTPQLFAILNNYDYAKLEEMFSPNTTNNDQHFELF